MRNCKQCGAEVSDKARFCEMCGSRLDLPSDLAPPDRDGADGDVEELDLTGLDKEVTKTPSKDTKSSVPSPERPQAKPDAKPKPEQKPKPKQGGNIIDLKDVLESEEKIEADDSIKREVLADDEVLTKICPMCGEEIQLNSALIQNTPVLVKCLKCGNETKIW